MVLLGRKRETCCGLKSRRGLGGKFRRKEFVRCGWLFSFLFRLILVERVLRLLKCDFELKRKRIKREKNLLTTSK